MRSDFQKLERTYSEFKIHNMQGVVLAAGQSSRFSPFNNGGHKTMISLLGKPILAHTIEGIKKAGIQNIILVVKNKEEIKEYFDKRKDLSLNITYVVQDKATGMGDGLLRAEEYIKEDFILLGGNHVNSNQLINELFSVEKSDNTGVVLVEQRNNTWEYGVVGILGKYVTSVIEKPPKGKEPSKFCLVSMYYLPHTFLSILKKLKKHHYSFETGLGELAKEKKLLVTKTKQTITTLKYPWDILSIKNYLLKSTKTSIHTHAYIAKSAEIIGNAVIEEGAKIMEGARIKGPCYIGKNVVVGDHALLRSGVDVEAGCMVGSYMEVKNSLILENTSTHSGFIGDSVIGKNCKIGGQFGTANVRIDRTRVKTIVKNEKVDTGLKYLGAIIGDNVRIGIKASTMPGVIIGNNVSVGPSTTVLKNIPDDTRYYTKFQEIVSEK